MVQYVHGHFRRTIIVVATIILGGEGRPWREGSSRTICKFGWMQPHVYCLIVLCLMVCRELLGCKAWLEVRAYRGHKVELGHQDHRVLLEIMDL